ncbi:hypothetical protein [Ornithinibacillus sp. FSL M8-0202]|uniref:hypothetical protein n=1 Tax=unclassified Ornithinibacillus TaxID=2620869 RepID=UPI0030D1F538
MKRYIALFVLLTVMGQFYYAHAVFKHENPILAQEYDTPTASTLDDFSPVGGDGKLKITFLFLGTILVVTFIFVFSFNRFVQFVKRRTVLCPIFYQSNYLISTSLKIS